MLRFAIIAVGLLALPPEGLEDVAGEAVAIDGDTIAIGNRQIHLWGIEAPALERICRETGGAEWPCGLYAKQVLENLIAAATVVCAPQGLDQAGVIVAVCTIDGRDLAWAIVAFGFAVDVPEISGGAYREPQAQSAAVRAGIWSGTMGDAKK